MTDRDLRAGIDAWRRVTVQPLLKAERVFADYIMTTHADTPRMDVSSVEQPDIVFNQIGAHGLGEIGLADIGAAITYAVHHATGARGTPTA